MTVTTSLDRLGAGVLSAFAALAVTTFPSNGATQVATGAVGHVENVQWEQIGSVIIVYYDLLSDDARAVFTVTLDIVRTGRIAADHANQPVGRHRTERDEWGDQEERLGFRTRCRHDSTRPVPVRR